MLFQKNIIQKILIILLFCGFCTAYAAPAKKLWPRWQPYNAKSTRTINHQAYQKFLNSYVITSAAGINLVRYAKVTAADKAALKAYLNRLAKLPIGQYNRNVQLAYWINFYNALTIYTVLKNYPVKSIRDIKTGWFSGGIWNKHLIKVDGVLISLNGIEHRIVRPIWNDPRTHFALNCASYSCPNLQRQAYTGRTINGMLTQDAIIYINSPRGVSIKNNELIVSSIFDWYQSDFGKNEQAVINFLKKYAKPKLKEKLNKFHEISDYQYNWKLNAAS